MATNFRIRAKADGKTGEVLLYGDVGEGWFGGVSAKAFADDLKALGNGITTLNIRINSAGGDVFDGLAIYNTLRRYPAQKNVSIDGMALSIASIIAMAGDHIAMAENAMMMIHKPWSAYMGTAEDFRSQADLLDQVEENLVATYERRTQAKGEHIRGLMAAETWMRGPQALDEGFIDEVTADLAIAAHFDPNRFKNVPPEIRAKVLRSQQSATPLADLARTRVRDLERMSAQQAQ